MSSRSGVEIDYCPQCRGVWLDRGEIDKLIEREQQQLPPEPAYDDRRRDDRDYYDSRRDRDHRSGMHQPYRKKRGGFLGDIFEGFGGD